MPTRGCGRSWKRARKPTAHSVSVAGLRRDDHHLVADRLHDRRLGGQRRLDRVDEALDHVERLLVALLLGVAGEPGQVDEAERHRDPRQAAARPADVGLHVADDVLLDVEAQVAVVHVLHQRAGDGEQVGRQVAHLLGDLERRHLLLHQRLVDVEVEEADLGVGDPADRLGVDADQLQEGDEREAGLRGRWRSGASRCRSSSLSIPSAPIGVPSSVISRSISSGSSPVSSAACSRV